MTCLNPATEQPLACPQDHTPEQVEHLLARAADAFAHWRQTTFDHRSRLMRTLANVLRRDREPLARLMATEMGKPLTAGESEVDKCAATCDYFAEHAPAMLAPQEIPSDAARSLVRYEPLGPVLAVMPWNFPLWQVFRFAAPALMAGNVGLLKHAANVPGCAAAIERAVADAGFPDGAFTTLFLHRDAIPAVIAHPAVAAVTLTGSTAAGRSVAAHAGKALKKTVLELGGSDPFIVLPDADVAKVAKQAAAARCINSGQSCIAAKRFIVVGGIAEAFESAMANAMRGMTVGDPLDRATQVGPLARLDLLDELHGQVRRTLAAGARLLCGGRRLPRTGYFYEPTVLADVQPGMPAFDEETFGPVAAITRAPDADAAVALANQSQYGLGASVWTSNPAAAANDLAPRIESGNVFINGPVKSDPRLPFGGIKQSGYGRELSTIGIREFVNTKTVWIGPA